MFKYIFKSSLYYMMWNKFKSQFITIIVSIILVAIIFNIYADLYNILEISDTQNTLLLLLLKWFLFSLIFGYNWYSFSKLKYNGKKQSRISDTVTTSYKREESIEQFITSTVSTKSIYHQNVLNKKRLKTKTDVILKKYIEG